MRVPVNKGTELHDRDEAGEVENFGVGVAAVEHARKVEELSTLVNFCPESLLQSFLGCAEGCSFLNKVKVGEHTDDFREPMRLENVEEFERFL